MGERTETTEKANLASDTLVYSKLVKDAFSAFIAAATSKGVAAAVELAGRGASTGETKIAGSHRDDPEGPGFEFKGKTKGENLPKLMIEGGGIIILPDDQVPPSKSGSGGFFLRK